MVVLMWVTTSLLDGLGFWEPEAVCAVGVDVFALCFLCLMLLVVFSLLLVNFQV